MIGILFTGGTISMTVDPATGAAVPSLGARDLQDLGVMFAGDLGGPKGRILLMVALGFTNAAPALCGLIASVI